MLVEPDEAPPWRQARRCAVSELVGPSKVRLSTARHQAEQAPELPAPFE